MLCQQYINTRCGHTKKHRETNRNIRTRESIASSSSSPALLDATKKIMNNVTAHSRNVTFLPERSCARIARMKRRCDTQRQKLATITKHQKLLLHKMWAKNIETTPTYVGHVTWIHFWHCLINILTELTPKPKEIIYKK